MNEDCIVFYEIVITDKKLRKNNQWFKRDLLTITEQTHLCCNEIKEIFDIQVFDNFEFCPFCGAKIKYKTKKLESNNKLKDINIKKMILFKLLFYNCEIQDIIKMCVISYDKAINIALDSGEFYCKQEIEDLIRYLQDNNEITRKLLTTYEIYGGGRERDIILDWDIAMYILDGGV